MTELTLLQKKVLNLFSKSSIGKGFYWTAGTLLSYFYLHHRQSKDLDFFSDEPFSYEQIINFVRKFKKEFKLTKIEEKKIFDRYEFFLHNKDELRLEFVSYEYPKIRPRKKWQGILIDSLEDIAANKVMALFDRNDPKDLVDLYFLLEKKNYKIKILLKWVERKFGVELEESSFWGECCKGLEDLDEISPLLLAKNQQEKKEVINNIRDYFRTRSTNYLRKILK